MAVKIRMRRMGNRNRPFYRLVVTDSRTRRDGTFIEVLGHYNPLTEPAEFTIKEEQAVEWLKKGAKMSDTVKSLFKRQGVLATFTGKTFASLEQEGEKPSKKVRKREKTKAAAAAEAKEEEPKHAEAPAEAASTEAPQEVPAENAPADTPQADEQPTATE